MEGVLSKGVLSGGGFVLPSIKPSHSSSSIVITAMFVRLEVLTKRNRLQLQLRIH